MNCDRLFLSWVEKLSGSFKCLVAVCRVGYFCDNAVDAVICVDFNLLFDLFNERVSMLFFSCSYVWVSRAVDVNPKLLLFV